MGFLLAAIALDSSSNQKGLKNLREEKEDFKKLGVDIDRIWRSSSRRETIE